jgi:S1-C subfamily serine protease
MVSYLVEFSNNLADAVERVGASVVAVLEGGREGVSGILWRDGFAVTAEHTIRGHDAVTVVLPSGEKTTAAVAGRDPGTDIAVLKVPQKTGFASLADESCSRVGEIVLSVGRRGTEGLAATFGVISALGGPWRTWQGARVDRWFRLDLNPFSGFSGGPIVNSSGEVLGIATSGPRRLIVTIPTTTVTRVIDQLLQRGHIVRGYLGVGMQSIKFPDSIRQSLGINSEHGLLIISVAPDSPAERSGVLLGDIIVNANGSPVHSPHSLQPALDDDKVGEPLNLEIVRGGKLHKLSVTVGERPES